MKCCCIEVLGKVSQLCGAHDDHEKPLKAKIERQREMLDRWRHAGVLGGTPLMQATCEVLGLKPLRDTAYFDRYKCGHSFPNRKMESRDFEVPCPDCYMEHIS